MTEDTSTKSPFPALDDNTHLVQLFLEQVRQHVDAPFLWEKKGNLYQHSTWREIAGQVNAVARALMAHNIARGDRVAVIAPNGPKCFIADMAIMMIGAVTVAVPRKWNLDEQQQALRETKSKAVIVGRADTMAALFAQPEVISDVTLMVCMEPVKLATPNEGLRIYYWQDFINSGNTSLDRTREPLKDIKPGDNACLIYEKDDDGRVTSVRHTHNGIIGFCRYALSLLQPVGLTAQEVFFTVLPFAHGMGHTVGGFLPMVLGGQGYFSGATREDHTMLEQVRPTVMSATSEHIRALRDMLTLALTQGSSLDRKMMDTILAFGKIRYEKPQQLQMMHKLKFAVMKAIIGKRLKNLLGGRLKAILAVDSKGDYNTFLFFHSFDIEVKEMERNEELHRKI